MDNNLPDAVNIESNSAELGQSGSTLVQRGPEGRSQPNSAKAGRPACGHHLEHAGRSGAKKTKYLNLPGHVYKDKCCSEHLPNCLGRLLHALAPIKGGATRRAPKRKASGAPLDMFRRVSARLVRASAPT